MHVVIRADADARQGWGHMVRCLALGQALKQGMSDHTDTYRDAHLKVTILGYGLPAPLYDACRALGFEHRDILQGRLKNESDLSEEQDAAAVCDFMSEETIDLVLLDHYELGLVWQEKIRARAPLALFHDMPQEVCTADFVINGAPGAEDYYPLKAPATKYFLGLGHASVRHELRRCLEQNKERQAPQRGPMKGPVMLSLGRTHVAEEIGRVLEVLLHASEQPVILMASAQAAANVRRKIAPDLLERVQFAVDIGPQKLAQYLSSAALYIGAGGVTALEASCFGVPMLLIEAAPNQRAQIAAFQALGVAISCGSLEDFLTADLNLLLRQAALLRPLTPVCDGRGADRIAAGILYSLRQMKKTAERGST